MGRFESLVASALLEGVEVTINELIEILGLKDQGALQGALEVLERIEQFGLVLDPQASIGELTTARVLKSGRKPDEAVLRDRCIGVMSRGESNTVEFKSSLIADMKRLTATGQLHALEALEGECLKTVCALLNSGGGTLLIGVDDEGIPCGGLTKDLEFKSWDTDAWLLHWNALIKGRFDDGLSVLPFVRSAITEIEGERICVVDVLRRERPAFVRRMKGADLEFFVRLGPQSESLSLPAFYEYISESLRQKLSGQG